MADFKSSRAWQRGDRLWAGIIWLPEHALDAAHHRLALKAGNDLGEVVEVPDFELDLDLREVLGAAHHAHIINVAVGLADDLCDLCQCAGLVERRYDDLGGK